MPDQRIIALLDTMIRIAKGEENINLAQETINQLAALNRGLASRVVAVSEIAKEDNEFDLLGALKDMRNEQTDTPSSSEPSQTGGINFPDEPRAPPGKQGIFSESGSFLDRAWDRAHQDLSDPEPHGNVEWAASHQFGRREFIIAATVLIALITGIIGYSYITAPTETTPATATRVVNVEERDAPSPKMTVTSTPPTHPPKQASKPTKPTQPAKAPKANPPHSRPPNLHQIRQRTTPNTHAVTAPQQSLACRANSASTWERRTGKAPDSSRTCTPTKPEPACSKENQSPPSASTAQKKAVQTGAPLSDFSAEDPLGFTAAIFLQKPRKNNKKRQVFLDNFHFLCYIHKLIFTSQPLQRNPNAPHRPHGNRPSEPTHPRRRHRSRRKRTSHLHQHRNHPHHPHRPNSCRRTRSDRPQRSKWHEYRRPRRRNPRPHRQPPNNESKRKKTRTPGMAPHPRSNHRRSRHRKLCRRHHHRDHDDRLRQR